MADQTPSPTCPQCGAKLESGAAQGLCPHCLMLAAAEPTEPAVSGGEAVSLDQITAAFPQLEVLEMIGQGGMGAVFKVRQPKLDRFAALKLLPQSMASDPAFAGRFEREARLLARLNHPNIVAVYDYGQGSSFFYLLMEFVDGVNLRQAMRASRFEPRQALGIVPKICEALQYAHDEGVLHRDIKPENILLDTKGRVKLVDFGIAKLMAEADVGNADAAAASPDHTQTGVALGTPSYMAPEQREHPSDVDHRADIYSLGVVFYELLTGELPAGGVIRPSEKSGADPRVDAIVQQALEKERDRRQHSALEVRTQVEKMAELPPDNQGRVAPPISLEPRFSLLAIIGAFGPVVFLAVGVAAAMVPIPIPAVAWWQPLLQWAVWLTAILAAFGTTILGWLAVSQIRRSAGQLYGLALAVFDGLVFPLLALDGIVFWAWRLAFAALFPEFFDGGSIVDRTTGRTTSLQSIALLLALVTSAIVDFVIAWLTWRALTRPKKSSSIDQGDPATAETPMLVFIAQMFWGMSGVTAMVAWFRMPDPPQIVVWAILASAIVAVLLAIPVRTTPPGKKVLIGSLLNIAVWLVIFALFAVSPVHPVVGKVSSSAIIDPPKLGQAPGALVQKQPIADFRCRVFEADAALVDRLIPADQRTSAKPGVGSINQATEDQAEDGPGDENSTTHVKLPKYTDAQVAKLTPAILDALLQAIDNVPGVLHDRTTAVSSASWQTGVSDTWSYISTPENSNGMPDKWTHFRAPGVMMGNGMGVAFLKFRQNGGMDQIHIDCLVSHWLDTPGIGKARMLNSLLYFKGSEPPDAKLAFLVPFSRNDGSARYLMVVYEITRERLAGAASEGKIEISSGLSPGEIVVVGGTDGIHDGSKVTYNAIDDVIERVPERDSPRSIVIRYKLLRSSPPAASTP